MTRRDAIKGLLAIPLLGAWRLEAKPRPVDLRPFLGDHQNFRHEIRYPFEQEGFAYATNGKICVRTLFMTNDVKTGDEFQFPKACGLPWNHDDVGGWVKMPKRPKIEFHEDYCPTCDGTGVNPKTLCDRCQGYWEGFDGHHCRKCKMTGYLGTVCQECDGTPYGNFPTRVVFGEHQIHRTMWEKMQTLRDVELSRVVRPYWTPHDHKHVIDGPIRFRFDGGLGLVMPMRAD